MYDKLNISQGTSLKNYLTKYKNTEKSDEKIIIQPLRKTTKNYAFSRNKAQYGCKRIIFSFKNIVLICRRNCYLLLMAWWRWWRVILRNWRTEKYTPGDALNPIGEKKPQLTFVFTFQEPATYWSIGKAILQLLLRK